jgi:glutamine amidotransferase
MITPVCRHLAYVGPRVFASSLVLSPPHSLVTQVDQPRCQLPGITNRDGWGIAWRDGDDHWSRHRSAIPFSEDHDGQSLVDRVESGAVVAAVRRASPGLALVESGNAPFVSGPWAFSLNGFVGGFSSGAREPLVGAVSSARRDALAGDTDSEVLFALVLDAIDGGSDPESSLRDTVQRALDAAGPEPSRLNLLLSDGTGIWATRWSNSLFHHRAGDEAVAVASEPWDGDPAWCEVPDRSVVTASTKEVRVRPLA